jgi:cysteinyl-tRNA synthetase
VGLRLFNSLGREVQDFSPIVPGKVGFYGCGPTVYNYAHIGNLRAYVFLDTLDRTLSFLGYEKTHVMNITDIGHLSGDGEDKMLRSAKERGQTVLEIAAFYTDAFLADTARLNILRPKVMCKATEHIPDMIELIKRIEANGHTYTAGGNLYFDIATFPDYGKLAGIVPGEKTVSRVDADANKRNPQDFVLWFTKSKFENQALVWDSPWGRGYPGWHIECSAMSMKYLGEQFDIHTGGIDHIPVHHTNEIAQSESATGKKWVKYWLHNDFLVIAKDADSGGRDDGDAGKMSKSAGNFLTLQSLVDMGYDPLDYRFFLLGAHYRSQVAFSRKALDGARNARKALVQRVSKIIAEAETETALSKFEAKLLASNSRIITSDSPVFIRYGSDLDATSENHKDFFEPPHIKDFLAALENDLATPRALSALQGAVKDKSLAPVEKLALIKVMDDVFALSLTQEAETLLLSGITKSGAVTLSANAAPESGGTGKDAGIAALVAERVAAKKAKNYARADEIRAELQARGILLEDTPAGTIWKRASGI